MIHMLTVTSKEQKSVLKWLTGLNLLALTGTKFTLTICSNLVAYIYSWWMH